MFQVPQLATHMLDQLREMQEEGLQDDDIDEDEEPNMVCVVASGIKLADLQIPDSMTGDNNIMLVNIGLSFFLSFFLSLSTNN